MVVLIEIIINPYAEMETCTHFDGGVNQLFDFFDHELVEVGMESVNGTVDTDRDRLLAHFVE